MSGDLGEGEFSTDGIDPARDFFLNRRRMSDCDAHTGDTAATPLPDCSENFDYDALCQRLAALSTYLSHTLHAAHDAYAVDTAIIELRRLIATVEQTQAQLAAMTAQLTDSQLVAALGDPDAARSHPQEGT